jgi:O-antigen ligase
MASTTATLNTALPIEQPISRWLMALLVLLPFLILASRVTSDITASFCALFLLGFWFLRPKPSMLGSQQLLKQQLWFKVFLGLWLYMMVTAIFTADPQYVFSQAVIAIRWPALAAVVSCVILTNQRRLQIFEKSALALLAFIIFDTLFQYFYGQDLLGHVSNDPKRLTGPFTKLVPGSYSLRIYPMALLALLVITRNFPKPKFLAVMVAAMGLSQFFAFLTGERVVFLLYGLVNFALLVALIYKEKLSYRFVLASLTGFIVIAGASVMLFPKVFQRTIVSFYFQLTHFQDGTSYPIFVTAHRLWETSPWIGIGTRYFEQSCHAMPPAEQPLASIGGCVVHPHHIYLEWLTQNGVIGLVLFVVVLFFIFKTLWTNLNFKDNLLQSTVVLIALVMLFNPITPSMSIQNNNFGGEAWLLVGWALARALVNGRKLATPPTASATQREAV